MNPKGPKDLKMQRCLAEIGIMLVAETDQEPVGCGDDWRSANLTSCHPKKLAINKQILVAAKYHTSL
jgi:hypothetical protein